MFSSHGHVSSYIKTCLVLLDHRTISGRSVVSVMCSGNFKRFPKSTSMIKSGADERVVFFASLDAFDISFGWLVFVAYDGCLEDIC